MARAFQYGNDFDTFEIDPDGTLFTRFYTTGWAALPLAGPNPGSVGTRHASIPGRTISVVLNFRGMAGRIDLVTDAAGGGIIHAWWVPPPNLGAGWNSEYIG